MFAREDEHWIATVLIEGDVLDLPELGIQLPLLECYAGLDVPSGDARLAEAPRG